ncbi:nuclear transport factor 2 family protein [Nocardia sp. CA-135953]|uniref:nuclear transport factor 2 family protein n=1 Tax=Nocardia sp. CA-135953 TaxID=3239978 RepID=UPI003D959E69
MSTTIQSTADVFAIVDTMDVDTFASLFTEHGELTFANSAPLVGPEQIRQGTQAFFDTIAGLSHTILEEWNSGSDTIVELSVTYHRQDGQHVTIPVVSIWHRDGDIGKIDRYRVYFDLAPVYA